MTAAEQLAQAQAEDEINILDKTTCLLLRFHKAGLIRKGNIAKIQTEANKNRLGLHKKILTSDNYDNMMLIARDLRRYTTKRHVPGSPFSEGTHLIPVELITDINAKISNAETAYNNWADLFVAEYATLVEEAKAELKDQFDPNNYFDVSTEQGRNALRSKFWVERRWFDWVPVGCDKAPSAVAEQERIRHAEDIKDMAGQVKAALRVGLKKLVDHLVERLTPQPDGTRKKFAATTINKIVDFLELFHARNVCGDKELAVLADQAKEILAGQTPESIRHDEDVAETVASRMSEVKDTLDKLVQDTPIRNIYLDDDDEDDEG